MSLVPYFRLSAKRARRILTEVERAVAGWRKQGRSLRMSKIELDELAPAFEHRERQVARDLARTSA